MIKVTVSLQTKKDRNIVQAVMQYKTAEGLKKQVWKTTGVRLVKGQKKELMKVAEKKAEELRAELEKELNKDELQINNETIDSRQEMFFENYMKSWLDSVSNTKRATTIGGYSSNINAVIIPYFKGKKIKLKDLKTIHLQDFFDSQYRLGKSPKTVKNYYNNIHQALEKARKIGIIASNPADDCELEKPKQFIPNVYKQNDINRLLQLIKGSDIEVPIVLISIYGLRREEALGIKWDKVDWENNTITISHVITTTTINGKRVINKSDNTKNNSSYRSLPLSPIRDFLLDVKRKQEADKKLFGNTYKNDDNYICVNDEGELIKPDTLTKKFARFLKKNNLPKIRVHDLRHSVGSLLIKEVSTRAVQEWLGHANVSTTEIYTHLDSKDKETTAEVITEKLRLIKTA